MDEDGIEDAFELTAEIPEKIRTGIWVSPRFQFYLSILRVYRSIS